MSKNKIWLVMILSIILLVFSINGFTAYYKYTQESGANFYVGIADKADALEDSNEVRQILDDLGNLLGHSKRDDLYPKDGTTGGYLGRLNYGLDASKPAVPVVNDMYLATDTVKVYRCFVAGNWVEVYPGAGGVTTFLELSDTPANYTGQANKYIKVNVGETALEFGTINLSLYYLKTEIDTLSKVENIYSKDIIDSDELAVLKFIDLADTPVNYTGNSLKFARVNVGETALEFAAEADPNVDTDAEIKAILVDEVIKTGDFTAGRLPEIDNSTGIIKQSDIEHKANGGYDFNINSAGFTTQTATGDGNTICDWRIGLKFRFVFGAQNEPFTFTNPEFSCHLQIILIQDGVGSRLATWPAGIFWVNGNIPALSTAANARDIVNFFFDDYDDVYYGMGAGFAVP